MVVTVVGGRVVVVCFVVVVGLAVVVVGLTVVVVVLLVVVVVVTVAEVVVDEGATVVDAEPALTVVWGTVVGGSVEVDVTLVTVVMEVSAAPELRLWMPKYQPSAAPHKTTSTARVARIQTQGLLFFVCGVAAGLGP
jgi:hypothetical protein